jgi:hypothetical protein
MDAAYPHRLGCGPDLRGGAEFEQVDRRVRARRTDEETDMTTVTADDVRMPAQSGDEQPVPALAGRLTAGLPS